jgi:hypothetical protein
MSGTDPVHVRNIEKIIYYCFQSFGLLYVILKTELEKLFDFSIREIIYEKITGYYYVRCYSAYGRLQFSS